VGIGAISLHGDVARFGVAPVTRRVKNKNSNIEARECDTMQNNSSGEQKAHAEFLVALLVALVQCVGSLGLLWAAFNQPLLWRVAQRYRLVRLCLI
jgi:hypothetical protein